MRWTGTKQSRIRWRRAVRNHRTELQDKRDSFHRSKAKSGHRYVEELIWPLALRPKKRLR